MMQTRPMRICFSTSFRTTVATQIETRHSIEQDLDVAVRSRYADAHGSRSVISGEDGFHPEVRKLLLLP